MHVEPQSECCSSLLMCSSIAGVVDAGGYPFHESVFVEMTSCLVVKLDSVRRYGTRGVVRYAVCAAFYENLPS